MPKNTRNKKPSTGRIRADVDSFIAAKSKSTFNYRQVAQAIGQESNAAMRIIALYLAELALDRKSVV